MMNLRALLLALLLWHPLSQAGNLEAARTALEAQQLTAAEALLRPYLTQHPEDQDARFMLARALAWQSRLPEAQSEYKQLLQAEPANADYMLGLAQTYLWQQQAEDALPWLAQAQTLAPDNPDILRARIQALIILGRNTEALHLKQAASGRFPQETWDQLAIPAEPQALTQAFLPDAIDRKFYLDRNSQAEFGLTQEHLTHGNVDWQNRYLNLEHSFAPRSIAYATLSEYQRFDLTDHELLAGFYYPLTPLWTLNMEGNFSSEHQVVARHSVFASLQHMFGQGWNVTGGLRQTSYNQTDATQGTLTLEHYFQEFRLAYTLTPTRAVGTTTLSHDLQFSWYYADTSYVNVAAGAGREAGLGGAGERRMYDTRHVGINGRHWLNPDWAFTWQLGRLQQGDAYDKNGMQIGLRRAF